jgi:hypothetical protein
VENFGVIYKDTALNRCGRFEIIIEIFVAEGSGWQKFVIGFDPEQANMTTKKIRNGSRSNSNPWKSNPEKRSTKPNRRYWPTDPWACISKS